MHSAPKSFDQETIRGAPRAAGKPRVADLGMMGIVVHTGYLLHTYIFILKMVEAGGGGVEEVKSHFISTCQFLPYVCCMYSYSYSYIHTCTVNLHNIHGQETI